MTRTKYHSSLLSTATLLLASILAVSSTLFVAPVFAACSNAYVSPSISLSPTHGPTGTVVTVTGQGFCPNVGIILHSSTGTLAPSGTFTTDSSGKFTATVTVTAASAPKIDIRASGADQASIPKDTATALFTVDNLQAGKSSNVIVTGGSGTEDDTAKTGVSVTISGATGVSNVTVTTAKLNGPGQGVALVSSGGTVLYFDVKVTLPHGTSAPSGSTVQVCFTDPTVTSSDTLQYFDGTNWVTATSVTVTGTQVCGTVPLSALTGTNFAVTVAAAADYTWVYISLIVVFVVVIIAVGVVMMRRRRA